MRRIWVVCAALVLLAGFGAGCGHQPTPDQGEIKQAFIRQLIAFCADVDRQLANVSMERQPGIYAAHKGVSQLERMRRRVSRGCGIVTPWRYVEQRFERQRSTQT